jgi:sugar phosphate isomerase/epimerase
MYHLLRDPDLDGAVDGTGPPVGLLQICDIDYSDDRARRMPLDEGAVDWRSFLAKVRRLQPSVPIELELFADQLPGRSAVNIIRSTAKLLAALPRLG